MKAFVRSVFGAGSKPPPAALARRMGALTSIYYRGEHAYVQEGRAPAKETPPIRSQPLSQPKWADFPAPDSLPERLRPMSFRNAVEMLVQDRAPEADHIV